MFSSVQRQTRSQIPLRVITAKPRLRVSFAGSEVMSARVDDSSAPDLSALRASKYMIGQRHVNRSALCTAS